jgi:hypothetical protein
MSRQHTAALAARQTASVDAIRPARSTRVDRQDAERTEYFAVLRQVISERGYTIDAICAAMGEQGVPMDRGRLHKLLNDPEIQKQWRNEHYLALPDVLTNAFEARRTELRGAIVAEPLYGEAAARAIVGAVVGLLAPKLPARASGMAKASLPENDR